MSDRPDDSQPFSRFIDFINTQLDLSDLEETPRLNETEIEQQILPLIRGDITRETLRIVDQLLRESQSDVQRGYWRARLAPFHREVRQCLAQTLGDIMEFRHPNRLCEEEWTDVATFIITVAWLVRKQIDSDEPPSDN